jgi:hypothetical protein
VEALSPTDAWAVGYRPLATGDEAFVMHWDGRMWRVVPVPALPEGRLQDVSAVSATDVWAVGYFIGVTAIRPLTLHWDGTEWTRVPASSAGSTNTQLNGVATIATDDAWAVGLYEPEYPTLDPLIEHWDGDTWSVSAPAPVPGGGPHLRTVSAVSSTDVWAAGGAMVQHWDGSRWRVVPLPRPRASIYGLSAVSEDDAWAAGGRYVDPTQLPFTYHWDGVAWNLVETPAPGGHAVLFDIDAVSARNIWAVGGSPDEPSSELLTMHSFGCQIPASQRGSPLSFARANRRVQRR